MIENYISDEWQTSKELLRQYKADGNPIAARTLRKAIDKYNSEYFTTERKAMIIYSNQGYKITSDRKEIEQCMNEHLSNAVVHFKKYHRIAKAMGFKINYDMIFSEESDGNLLLTEKR